MIQRYAKSPCTLEKDAQSRGLTVTHVPIPPARLKKMQNLGLDSDTCVSAFPKHIFIDV